MKEKIFWIPVISAVAAAALTFSGCTKSVTAPQAVSEKDVAALTAAGKTQQAAAEDARIGELLMMPEGFQYADQMFDKALALDPNNAKANIYKSVTEPMMALKGYIARVEPLMNRKDTRALERLRQNIRNLNMPELDDYSENLASGQTSFQNYHDVQRFMRTQVLPAMQDGVDRLNRVDASTPIQFNFTPARALIDPTRKTYYYSYGYSSCTNDPTQGWRCTEDEGTYESSDKQLPNLYFVDRYDLKIMKASMLAMVDSIRLATAFSSEGSEDALKQIKAVSDIRQEDGTDLSSQDVIQILNSYPALFTLESDQQLGAIAGSAAQALQYGMELANLQDTLCKGTSRDATNSLISPICFEADTVSSLQTGLDLIAGPKVVSIGTDEDGNDVNILMDVNAILNHPPQDLKTLLPNQFDKLGNPTQYPDPTMAGLFPNGDIVSKLKQLGSSSFAVQASSQGGQAVSCVMDGHLK
jgi:hypothetical protein